MIPFVRIALALPEGFLRRHSRCIARDHLSLIPDGNAMAPPKLAADAPVAQIIDPMEVGVFPVFRNEFDAFLLRRLRAIFWQSHPFSQTIV